MAACSLASLALSFKGTSRGTSEGHLKGRASEASEIEGRIRLTGVDEERVNVRKTRPSFYNTINIIRRGACLRGQHKREEGPQRSKVPT